MWLGVPVELDMAQNVGEVRRVGEMLMAAVIKILTGNLLDQQFPHVLSLCPNNQPIPTLRCPTISPFSDRVSLAQNPRIQRPSSCPYYLRILPIRVTIDYVTFQVIGVHPSHIE